MQHANRTPFADCTHAAAQAANTVTVVRKRQNNPYAINVLHSEHMCYSQPSTPVSPLTPASFPIPSKLDMDRFMSVSDDFLPLTPPDIVAMSPLTPMMSASCLTVIYRDGRPLPTFKTSLSSFPAVPTESLVVPYVCVIRFRVSTSHFNCSAITELRVGDHVVVEGDRGTDLGVVGEIIPKEAWEQDAPKERVLRLATADEVHRFTGAMVEEEDRAMQYVLQQIERLGLCSLHVHHVTFQYDMKKVTVWYTSTERVYFVPLLKLLHAHFKCRIWMQRMD